MKFVMLLWCSVLFVALLYVLYQITELIRKFLLLKKIYCLPGAEFLLGHLPLFTSKYDPTLYLSENATVWANEYFEIVRNSGVCVAWFTWVPYIIITNAKAVEAVLSSNKILSKSFEYRYFEPWVGGGVFTSEPNKWKKRRKMLTPTFHFRIIEDFLKIMNKQSMVLVEKITKRNEAIDLFEVIPLTTLDTICETAMGIHVNAQRNSDSEFVKAIVFVSETLFNRFLCISYWFDFIFYNSKLGKQFQIAIDSIHEFSPAAVMKRKDEIINERNKTRYCDETITNDNTIFRGSKMRKTALMDLLVKNHLESVQSDGSYLFTISDVCEEVDTFMFGGFDTTAAAICWTLHLLGNNEDIQNKAFDEIFAIFGHDTERFVTVEDFSKLKYVECCIKEALRLYPSAPIIARKTTEEIDICGNKIPSGITVLMYIFGLHRDPHYFPQPNEFIPKRFIDGKENRNPYKYIPFSAGPRNCIGQRFAMNEVKTIVTNVLRNFRLRSLVATKEIRVSIEIITKTKSKLYVNFERRS